MASCMWSQSVHSSQCTLGPECEVPRVGLQMRCMEGLTGTSMGSWELCVGMEHQVVGCHLEGLHVNSVGTTGAPLVAGVCLGLSPWALQQGLMPGLSLALGRGKRSASSSSSSSYTPCSGAWGLKS